MLLVSVASCFSGASRPLGTGHLDAGRDASLAPTVTVSSMGGRPIGPYAFGQNYWNWEPTWGAPIAGTEGLMAASGVKLIRAGGTNNETQDPGPFTNAELDALVTYCRRVGAEPIVQVSLLKNAAGDPATSADAAAMVAYANTTQRYGIKFWTIGNEPDMYATQKVKPASYSAADYCATFRQYAAAMRAADPTIQILGPELSWQYTPSNDWLTPFLDGCADVVDIVSVHRYPFSADATTVERVLGDASAFQVTIRSLRANLDRHGLTRAPLAITEENVTYEGDPAKNRSSASPQTFYAGMWVANNLGTALEEGLWTSAFWNIADLGPPNGWRLAFIAGTVPAPSYEALKLVATTFSGRALTPAGVPSGFAVYASRDDAAAKTAVLVLNKTSANAPLDIVIDGQPAIERIYPAESITALVRMDGTPAPSVTQYTKDLADQNQPPAAVP